MTPVWCAGHIPVVKVDLKCAICAKPRSGDDGNRLWSGIGHYLYSIGQLTDGDYSKLLSSDLGAAAVICPECFNGAMDRFFPEDVKQ